MYKAKTLSANSIGYSDTHSKTARATYARNNKSYTSKNSSSNVSLSHRHESSDELISQVEREITKWRDLRSSKLPSDGLKKRENDLRKIVSSRNNESNSSEKSARLPLQMNSALDLKNLSGHVSEIIPDSAKNTNKSGRSPMSRQDFENSWNRDLRFSDVSPKGNNKRKENGLEHKNFSSAAEIGKMNGIIVDPRMLYAGNPYNVVSEGNGIKSYSRDITSRKIPVFDLLTLYGPKNMSDSFEAKESDSNKNDLDNPNQPQVDLTFNKIDDDVKFDDLNAFLQDQIISTDDAEELKPKEKMNKEFMLNYKHYNKKSINKNLDDQYEMNNSQNGNTFKKHLSIIFSTGKSMEVSMDSRHSVESEEPKEPQNIVVLKTEEDHPIIKQKEEAAAVIMKADLLFDSEKELESPENEEHQKKSPLRPESEMKDVCTTKSSSIKNTEEEIMLNVIQSLKLESKENKPLEETITKLMEVYSRRIEKYEEKLKRVSEKCERYKLANQKLGQIIKNWEQEIDQLATTNKKLHDIAVGLENELETSKSKEKKFQTLYREQKQKTSKITEQNKKILAEFEAMKKELILKEEKNKSLTLYTQKSDELIQTISSSIRTLIVEKSANKISSDNLFKFLENIESEASKLVEELETMSGRKLHLTSPREIATLKHKLSISINDEVESPVNNLHAIIPPSLTSPVATEKTTKDVKKYESVPCVTSKTKTPDRVSLSIKTPQKRNSLAHSIELLMISPQSPIASSKRLASPTSFKASTTTSIKSKTPILPNQLLKKTLMRRLAGSESKKHFNWSLTQSINDDGTKTTEREDSSSYSLRNKSRDKNFVNSNDKVGARKK